MLLHQRFKFTWWPNPCDAIASKIQMYNTITWTIEQDSLNLNFANTLLVFTLFEKDKILINLLLMWSLLLFWLHLLLRGKDTSINLNKVYLAVKWRPQTGARMLCIRGNFVARGLVQIVNWIMISCHKRLLKGITQPRTSFK